MNPTPELRPYRYDGPIFGSFGNLRVVGDRVECHICGRLYRSVGVHATQAHGLPADEYREVFGLARSHALEGPATKARRREHGHRMVEAYGSRLTVGVRAMRSVPRGRPMRLETLIEKRTVRDPKQAATKRRDVCQRGHSMAGAYVRPSDGKRRCRVCSDKADHLSYLRRKAARLLDNRL